MNWISRAEARFSRYAISGLLRYVAFLNAAVILLIWLQPHTADFFILDPSLVLTQPWRLVTHIFVPGFGYIVGWLFAALYILYIIWLGDGLEQAMGAFRLNLFYFSGIIGIVIASFITGAPTIGGGILNTTLLLAFARFYPDLWIRLFFVLPVKVKWLAWATWFLLCLQFIGGTPVTQVSLLASIANFLLFFGRDIWLTLRTEREQGQRRRKFAEAQRDAEGETLHRCATCGRTEVTAPELDFRVSSDGQEYCVEHLPSARKDPP